MNATEFISEKDQLDAVYIYLKITRPKIWLPSHEKSDWRRLSKKWWKTKLLNHKYLASLLQRGTVNNDLSDNSTLGMKSVNPIYLCQFIAPLVGGADSEVDNITFARFNINLKEDVKYIFDHYLKPRFEKLIPELQLEAKKALAFYLSSKDYDFRGEFNKWLIPLDTP